MQSQDTLGQDLRVVILADKEGWFAQGLEIDHDAEGDSLQEVKRNFESGLAALVSLHMMYHGQVGTLLQATPVETWESLLDSEENFTTSFVSLKECEHLRSLPFSGIQYLEPTSASSMGGPIGLAQRGTTYSALGQEQGG